MEKAGTERRRIQIESQANHEQTEQKYCNIEEKHDTSQGVQMGKSQ
jgi:hypothetical protein